jgi:hypothetical protein
MACQFKHMTLLAQSSAAAYASIPMTIISHPIRDSLRPNCFHQGKTAVIQRKSSPYIDETLFLNVSRHYLFHESWISDRRHYFLNRILCYSWTLSANRWFIPDFAISRAKQYRCQYVPAAYHSSLSHFGHIIFGAFKTLRKLAHSDFLEKSLKHQIIKIIRASGQTVTSLDVCGVSCEAALSTNTPPKPYKFVFDESILRRKPGFREIKHFNLSMQSLCVRRGPAGSESPAPNS